MGDGFGADPEEIRGHAAELESGAFSTLEAAATAASGLTLGDHEAYGIILQFVIPPALDMCLDDAGAAIQSASDFAAGIREALDGCAGDYEGVDQEVQEQLGKIAKEIES